MLGLGNHLTLDTPPGRQRRVYVSRIHSSIRLTGRSVHERVQRGVQVALLAVELAVPRERGEPA